MKKKITGYDIALIVIILVANCGFIVANGMTATGYGRVTAYVYSENELYKEFVLGIGFSDEFTVRTDSGFNTIKIKDSDIWIEDSDCSDKLCVKQGKINKDGQVVICLPHKFSIKVKGTEVGGDVDAVSQ